MQDFIVAKIALTKANGRRVGDGTGKRRKPVEVTTRGWSKKVEGGGGCREIVG